MKKTYTKKQITEAIVYWTKELHKMNESKDYTSNVEGYTLHLPKDVNLTNDEAEDLISLLVDQSGATGETGPFDIQDETAIYGKDPKYGNGNEYDRFSTMFGEPSPKWIALLFSEYACDGNESVTNNLISAFKKLASAKMLGYNNRTNIMHINVTLEKNNNF